MGTVIAIDPKDLPAALIKADKRIRRAIADGALRGAHRGRTIVMAATPEDLGNLKAAWKVRAGDAEVSKITSKVAELYNDAPNLLTWVEMGTRPHGMSPEGWAAIYAWVYRHFRGGSLGGTGKTKAKKAATVTGPYKGADPEISKITNAIVAKIRKEGQKPRFFVRESMPAIRAAMATELALAISRAEADIRRNGTKR